MDSPNRTLPPVRRLVVKIGSALLAPEGVLSEARVRLLAGAVSGAREGGPDSPRQIVVVSSGAVASGLAPLGLDKPPQTISVKQAAAAVGQPRLMSEWAKSFARDHLHVAQVLLTADDLDARQRFLNARRTLLELLDRGIVPIINENDSVSFDEIKLGDNDRLSALVAGLIDADLLLILSGVPGLLEQGSSTRVVPQVTSLDDARKHVRPGKSGVGTGGMETKLTAAATAARWGITTIIASGLEPNVVARALAGELLGTAVLPAPSRRSSRKRWLESAARPKGTLTLDPGAVEAIRDRGSSLLPSGITAVHGEFARGSAVFLADPAGKLIARGLSAYSSAELARIKGLRRDRIAPILGYAVADEVVHRNDLVLLIV